jgi:3-oxoadipate enol-lactonase
VKLHHVDDGPRDAPALVLVGSLGSTLAMWEPQLTLAGPFRVIRVDHRGHGGSPTPPGPYAMADLAADVVELLDDLELRQVAFCGLSLGGMIGMYLGSEHPHRLTSLTLCCTTAHFADKAPWDQRIAAVEADGTAGIARHRGQPLVHPGVGRGAPGGRHRAARPDRGHVGHGLPRLLPGHRRVGPPRAAPRGRRAHAGDRWGGGPLHARRPARAHAGAGIPGARLEVLPGAHLATIESAAQASGLIAEHAGVTTS